MLALSAAASSALADTYTWVGNPAYNAVSQNWNYTVNDPLGGNTEYFNFSVNGSPPTSLPTLNDSFVFQLADDSYDNDVYMNVDATVKDMTFNGEAAHVAGLNEYGDVTPPYHSLQIASGNLTANVNVDLEDTNLLLSGAGTWNVAAGKTVTIDATNVVLGNMFSKDGGGTVTVSAANSLTGTLNILDGTVNVFPIVDSRAAGNYINATTVVVGNGQKTAGNTLLKFTSFGIPAGSHLISSAADITVHADGKIILDTDESGAMSAHSLTLDGGAITKEGSYGVTTGINATTTTAMPGHLSTGWQAASFNANYVLSSTFVPLTIPAGGKTISVLPNTVNGETSVDALHINMPIEGGVLTLNGTATTTLKDPSGAPSGSDQTSTFDGTVLQEGTLILARSPNMNTVGNALTIGKSGDANAAVVQVQTRDQIGDSLVPIILDNGTLRLMGVTDTIYELTLKGIADGGSAGLTLTGSQSDANVVDSTAHLDGLINLPGAGHIFDVNDGSQSTDFAVEGTIQGGRMTKQGAGTMLITGQYSAGMTVTAGEVDLNNTTTANANYGGVTVGTANATTNTPTVLWLADEQLSKDTNVSLQAGTLNLNGHTQSVNNLNVSGTGLTSVTTGTGKLILLNTSTVGANGALNFTGNLDLGDGTRFIQSNGPAGTVNHSFSGDISNGTIDKIGVGTADLANVTGNALLKADAGNVDISNVSLGGLAGSAGEVDIASGTTFTINDPAGTNTFSGVLSGAGNFTKSGAGTLTFSGNVGNSVTGTTTVSGGTLVLNKTTAVGGPLVIQSDGTVDATASYALQNNSITMSGGTLKLHTNAQTATSITMTGGMMIGDSSAPPNILMSGNLTLSNATIDPVSITSLSGSLRAGGGATASIVGYFANASFVANSGKLVVDGNIADVSPPSLIFDSEFNAQAGSTIDLLLGASGQSALIDVNGGFDVGTFDINTLKYVGQTDIDLSDNTDLPIGVYDLIDFSAHADTLGGEPTLSSFALTLPMYGDGHLAINGDVLQYVSTAVPEPGSLLGVLAVWPLFVRRRRWTVYK